MMGHGMRRMAATEDEKAQNSHKPPIIDDTLQ